MAGEGGAKKGGVEKMIFELGLQNTNFSFIKISLLPKFEIFIYKIEWVTSIFVGQNNKIFQSQNLSGYLK